MKGKTLLLAAVATLTVIGCNTKKTQETEMQKKVNEFAPVELRVDIISLSDKEKQMLPLLFEIAEIMDDLFWLQTYGDKEELLSKISDEATRDFVMINYGPWERLNDNKPFVEGYGEKPLGANFYPKDMTREEFEAFQAPDKTSLYTIIIRNTDGKLESVPYHVAYKEKIDKAADLLRKAAELAEDEGLKKYLTLRADALQTDDYFASDLAWMDMKTNNIDFVVGPIENYEDALFNYKAAYEAYILIKDLDWTQKINRFAALLPKLQESLPVEPEYKKEKPGIDSDLGVYEVAYYAGDCNSGSKTIAINLPNDPRVHLEKGSRKLQLKNAMKAKFEKILLPIGNMLIAEEQRDNIKFDAFFENVMFHEVAHGLGIKNLVNGKGTVREALKEMHSALEEGKADILGLYMVSQLAQMGELPEKDMMDNYVTFVAGIFRSVRFGAASSHGKANMVCFNYLKERGAFERIPETGTYRVNYEKMTEAMNSLAKDILTLQGNGDYAAVKKLFEEKGFITDELQADLNRVAEANIPRDINCIQGKELLGL
ncbi:MAG: Zn-dependent hydrolase [Tenuifilum sp.]|mgnify:CR=1 FL=1|uniref:dipeptidyl-peptidase 3 family protein n=1 Tax=Tenuifilum sp. TaxID=2760880 RepID=UPI001B3D92E2|nr:Zn-dependent hydrolase [Bacteroidales bacterium]HOK60949.1 Zn-dependent hydrolase [Tenuifilum sp.]MBP9028523.1 Zn-dependent hydrolase [Bacteroidales bacterium]HOK85350.1 Zn-dependent hydrolase [Tenuifilum sp.]HON70158.1 Zn-dependent hydrolase [Tenuifilum sp.]